MLNWIRGLILCIKLLKLVNKKGKNNIDGVYLFINYLIL